MSAEQLEQQLSELPLARRVEMAKKFRAMWVTAIANTTQQLNPKALRSLDNEIEAAEARLERGEQ